LTSSFDECPKVHAELEGDMKEKTLEVLARNTLPKLMEDNDMEREGKGCPI
jgi:hypothetical protein